MAKKPVALFFDRERCKKCGRHLALTAGKEHKEHYEINSSHEHNQKVIKQMKELQTRLLLDGRLDARNEFRVSSPTEIKISELLPTQPAIDHPNKFCYVANRGILEMPILVAKIGYKRVINKDVSALRGYYVILDGHTRSAVKLADSKNPMDAKINAVVLTFPNAESFYETYLAFQKHHNGHFGLDSLIRTAKERYVKGKWAPHPEACPGLIKIGS